MNKPNNKSDIIEFDHDVFVKITQTDFEYHFGVINRYVTKIPIDKIRKVEYSISSYGQMKNGCNFLFSFFGLTHQTI